MAICGYGLPSTVLQNKTKIFGVESEILIKYKRIKWTPSRKASLLLPGGSKKKNLWAAQSLTFCVRKQGLFESKDWKNKGISHVKWNYPPKGIEKKLKRFPM